MTARRANLGKEWEDILETVHESYRLRRLAAVTRNNPPVKQLAQHQALTFRVGGPEGRTRTATAFPAVYEEEGPPDFTVVARGVSMLLDAKDTTAESWNLGNLPRHQAEDFDDHIRQRCWAGVLLRIRRRMFLLPWLRGPDDDDLRGRWCAREAGKAERGWAELKAEHCLKLGVELRSPDWLGTALSLVHEPFSNA